MIFFLIIKDVNITSYADDNTLYDSCDTKEEVILSLQSSSKNVFQWLSDNTAFHYSLLWRTPKE